MLTICTHTHTHISIGVLFTHTHTPVLLHCCLSVHIRLVRCLQNLSKAIFMWYVCLHNDTYVHVMHTCTWYQLFCPHTHQYWCTVHTHQVIVKLLSSCSCQTGGVARNPFKDNLYGVCPHNMFVCIFMHTCTCYILYSTECCWLV